MTMLLCAALSLSLSRCTRYQNLRMKIFLASLLFATAGLLFSGCESDVPPDPQAKRGGPTGRGEIVQPDKSGDPLIRENTRVGY